MKTAFEGNHESSTDTLFNNEFISKNTKFTNFDDLLTAAPVKVNSQEDFDNLKGNAEMDAFIKENSVFNNFEDMVGRAFIENQLKNL